ncbi:hypothetical protein WISP_94234 [Willisornis vidua]|uniref:Uncharacterized protein n=1 Tax=Willisornis vidua TaxID=1566151 RepID=A0ABQ9D3E4_9PASS|nr:hypothetical protein WISP_94234 [Willisornis vidua]
MDARARAKRYEKLDFLGEGQVRLPQCKAEQSRTIPSLSDAVPDAPQDTAGPPSCQGTSDSYSPCHPPGPPGPPRVAPSQVQKLHMVGDCPAL